VTPTSKFWIDFFSWVGGTGAMIVIIGISLETAELLIKFKHEIKCRKWVVRKYGKKWRRELILCGKWLKPNLFWPFEVLGFAILFVGLVVEMVGTISAERLQSRENAILESTNVLLSLQVEELRKKNDELEAKTNPRIITPQQIEDFIFLTKTITNKIHIHSHPISRKK
jgi:hypothetical protein